MFVGGNLVAWRSKKQIVVSRLGAEAEFRSMAEGICKLVRLRMLMKDLRLQSKDPTKLFCHNKAAINIAHNPVQHDRTNFIEIDRHYIKEKLNEGIICMPL